MQTGSRYEITSKGKERPETYAVEFGGGKAFEQLTAWDPILEKFVYLGCSRDKDEPKPVRAICDHASGEVRTLYHPAKVKHALTAINATRICLRSGDKEFTKEQAVIYH